MLSLMLFALPAMGAAAVYPQSTATNMTLLTDINQISRYWGQITPYADNAEDHFGVQSTGLPEGCQVEQAHVLQRHAQRFPTSGDLDGGNHVRFYEKVTNALGNDSASGFSGPLSFLNSYRYLLTEDYLTNVGATTEFTAGTTFWNRYGRILYNATAGQVAYNTTYQNGTLVQSPCCNSQINWALGFFGLSFESKPKPTLSNTSDFASVVVIPEGGSENNTLASYDSCFNDYYDIPGYIGETDAFNYLPRYLGPATSRLQQYAPSGFTFNINDTYAMQSICAYENAYLGQGMSSFCNLFTKQEWDAFEYTLDILYYFEYGYGQPTGRAQGLGYQQELLARLQRQYITASNSSVNSTIDDNGRTFPLNQPFYADFSHDDIIVSVLTSMSIDYFREPFDLEAFPPDPERKFKMSNITPFGARLVTEVIGCTSPDPEPIKDTRVQYYPTQYGYEPERATNKFIRMRLNHGLLPLSSIRGGACDNGRPDGMCGMADFIESQKQADQLANYQYACFGDYNSTITDPYSGRDFDGTITERS